jgi:hypothetical protein
MFEYLQTQEGLCDTAIIAVLLIIAALALGAHPFKKKVPPVRTLQEANFAPWYANDYKKFLISKINAAQNVHELMAEMVFIDGYHDKLFRKPINRFTINRYYIELLEAYAEREIELTKVKIELCKN